ncbi:MAG: CAP domain-containing protein [Syntrophobacteraceae bacterium]
MKSGFCVAAILFCMLVPTSAANASVGLVSRNTGTAYAQSPMNLCVFGVQPENRPSRAILRERIVRLDPQKIMCISNVKSIQLQLFDNLCMRAVQTLQQRESDGFMLWTGQIQVPLGGKLVLVVRNNLIFASAYLPESIVQIRPVKTLTADASQEYVIRQIAYPWKNAERGNQTTLSVQSAVCPDCSLAAGLTPDAKRMVELVNLERKADGLPPLAYDSQLSEAARRHAADMAAHNYCSHELTNGEQFYQNVFDSGYPYSAVGENLAVGIATPEEAFECLLSSPDHRVNIMRSQFTQIGVSDAVNMASGYRYFWAQEFGSASVNRDQALRLSAMRPRL